MKTVLNHRDTEKSGSKGAWVFRFFEDFYSIEYLKRPARHGAWIFDTLQGKTILTPAAQTHAAIGIDSWQSRDVTRFSICPVLRHVICLKCFLS
ncbi:MAG: hypothetical protein LBU43_01555 [Candidatus Accumulibacter sp.]|jgi:hypothetical protein|nr:hypothetical protein [Accumulibacter sp.]